MKHLTSKSEQKFQRVMHEFGQGELKSHGEKVTNQKQALAIAFSEARKIDPDYGMMKDGGGITEDQAAALAKIYKTGTAQQLWEAWTPDNRIHFLMDHATEYFELMGDDFYKSSQGFSILTYDTLPSPIRKSVIIHHAQGMYSNGGGVEGDQLQLLKDRLDTIAIDLEDEDEEMLARLRYDLMDAESVQVVNRMVTNFENNELNKISDKKMVDQIKKAIGNYRGTSIAKTPQQVWKGWNVPERLNFIVNHTGKQHTPRTQEELANKAYIFLPKDVKQELNKLYAGTSMKQGGGMEEGIDLFEDYENIPTKVQKILDKYAEGFEDGDYDVLKKALEEVQKQGYTFEYYLDGQAYDLRKIGDIGKVEYAEKQGLMYNGGSVIGEPRAKEIVRNVLADAKANNISLPKLEKFIAEGSQPGVLIEAYSEFSKAVNNGSNAKSLRLNYEDSNRFRNYVMSLLPNSVQRKMHKHYGDAPIKKNFPGYAGGGGIPGSRKTASAKFAVGDKVLVDDSGYVKKFEGFDLTEPATIRDINKSKSGGKTYYFYKLEMANGDKPFNQAEEAMLTLASMAGGGEITKGTSVHIPSINKSGVIMDFEWLEKKPGSPAIAIVKFTDGTTDKFTRDQMEIIDKSYNGGPISYKLSPSKQKLLSRINTLKATKANAGAAAQKSIQKKIDVLQRQFDYNPSAKEKAMANKGKFALDVPASYSKWMYKKLWALKILPQIHKLNNTHSIVVSSKVNLDKAYEIYSDMLKEKKEKVPSLASISRKL